jgi:translation initiation factor 3 subunit E
MVDYVQQLADEIGASGADFQKMRDEATSKYQELQEKAKPILKVMEDPEAVTKLRSGGDREKNLEVLKTEYNVSSASQRR